MHTDHLWLAPIQFECYTDTLIIMVRRGGHMGLHFAVHDNLLVRQVHEWRSARNLISNFSVFRNAFLRLPSHLNQCFP